MSVDSTAVLCYIGTERPKDMGFHALRAPIYQAVKRLNMMLSVSAVVPIFLIMMGGVALRKLGQISDHTVTELNKIIFNYFFVFNMFRTIYNTELSEMLNPRFIVTILVLALLTIAALAIFVPMFFGEKKVQASLMQGILRSNAIFFALPVTEAIVGPQNTGLAALVIALIVPLYNLASVVMLDTLRGGSLKASKLAVTIVSNPMILGMLAGVAAKMTGLQLPAVLEKVVDDLAAMTTPLALILLGASLTFKDTLRFKKELAFACLAKLIVIPLAFTLVVHFMGLGPVAVTTAFAFAAAPTATSTYVMAKEMDADGPLAAQIIASTTALSMVTVFFGVVLLSSLGWIG